MDNEELDARFDAIIEDLHDLEISDEPLPQAEEAPVVAHITSRQRPRDWTPAQPDDDSSDNVAAENLLTLYPESFPVPTHRFSAPLWVAAALLLALAVLIAFGFLPGKSWLAFTFGALGFGCGAAAAFLAAPRTEDIDPFDDGARL